MKPVEIVIKIVLAVVAAAAIVFVVVKYGEQICAWFKKTFGCKCCESVEAPAEEPAEEVPTEQPSVEETPVEEVPEEEGEVIASESDFEG